MLPLRTYVVKSFLEGSVFELKQDVDYLYRHLGWESIVDQWRKDEELPDWLSQDVDRNSSRIHGGELVLKEIDSQDLPGREAQQAHQIVPITIRFGFFHQPNLYQGDDQVHGGRVFLNLGLPADLLTGESIAAYGYGKARSFTDEREIKRTIAHELAHWVDDSQHNRFVSTRPEGAPDFRGDHEVLRYPETQAFIHELRAVRDEMSDRDWDDLSIDDLLRELPNLASAMDNDLSPSQISQLKRNILSRLHREHMLGRSMR